MDKNQELQLQTVINILKRNLVSSMETYSHLKGFQVIDRDADCGHFQRCLVVMLLVGSDVHITLKIFFDPALWSVLLSKIYTEKISDDRSEELVNDAFKEVTNLMLGNLKRVFDEQKIEADLSLPVIMRGYDDIFANEIRYPHFLRTGWAVEFNNLSFVCNCIVQVKDPQFKIEDIDPGEAEIEFF